MTTQFDSSIVQQLAATEEIDIETRSAPDQPVHRATIWVVTNGDDVYVRSVRGPRGRWYRELIANPPGAIWFDGQRVPVRAVPASDAATVTRASEAYRQKYAASPYMPPLLVAEVLPTTLRLEPA
jgi:hypothetical protein